ncbi:hypothetical protein [Nocardia sp. AG03]|uniref:hypothetical protein n=1 Tax=Nocardia sp. AG03 TaxID=3025312 RepID=UPI0024186E50|nr:hypothetical protein [Nocardia sp. AG03]
MADSTVAASLRARWPLVARDLGRAFVLVPAGSGVLGVAAWLTAPSVLWPLAYLLVVVGAHGWAIRWVRERLWPAGRWPWGAVAYLGQFAMGVTGLAVSEGTWPPVWPVFVSLAAAIASVALAELARKRIHGASTAHLAESAQEIVIRIQTFEHRHRFGENPRRHGTYNVQVALVGDVLVVRAHDRLGPQLSGYPPQITPLLRIELRCVTAVSVRPCPPERYPWFQLPDGRPLHANDTAAVLVTTAVPGLRLTIPSPDAELNAEVIRRRIRWYAGYGFPRLP